MSESIDERRTAPAATEKAWVAALSGVHFVSWIAKEFHRSGVAREDLEAEGRLGLFDAALRFDASRGVQFLTYAAWWARRRMQTFVARHACVVRRPGSRPFSRRLETRPARRQEGARSPREITTAAAKSPLTLRVVRHMSRKRSTPRIMPIPSGGTPTMPRMSATTGSEPAGTPAVPMPPRTQIP